VKSTKGLALRQAGDRDSTSKSEGEKGREQKIGDNSRDNV